MRFSAKVVGQIAKDVRDFDRNLTRATTGAMREASTGLKGDLRAQVRRAFPGKGDRLANTWRSAVYPKAGAVSKDAAASVYSKAPHIIHSYDHGAIVRAKASKYLAIPLPETQKFVGLAGKLQKITPRKFELSTGIDLVFIQRPGKNPVLAAPGARRQKSGRVTRLKARGATKTMGSRVLLPKGGYQVIPVFVLIPQVSIGKRLDVERPFRKWGAKAPQLIDRNLARKS